MPPHTILPQQPADEDPVQRERMRAHHAIDALRELGAVAELGLIHGHAKRAIDQLAGQARADRITNNQVFTEAVQEEINANQKQGGHTTSRHDDQPGRAGGD